MNLVRRITRSQSKGASSSRAPPPEPPPPPTPPSSSESDDDNKEGLFQRRMNYLLTKEVRSTSYIDFSWLEQIGILDEFNRLTSRVGFTEKFWEIPIHHIAYIEPTREFLASLAWVEIPRKGQGIQFQLNGNVYRMTLRRLRALFHLPEGQTTYLGYIPEVDNADIPDHVHRRNFWRRLTNEVLPVGDAADPKITTIIHPVLRFLCRALGSSIFARGETTLRPLHRELALMATMLRPDNHLQRPDLMLHMVNHWIAVADGHNEGGLIMMRSYVTRIARRLNIDFTTLPYTACDYGQTMNKDAFANWHWIRTKRVDGQRVYEWKHRGGPSDLPIAFPPIDFLDDHTWRMYVGPAEPDADELPAEPQADQQQQGPPQWHQQYHNQYMARFDQIDQRLEAVNARAEREAAENAQARLLGKSMHELLQAMYGFHTGRPSTSRRRDGRDQGGDGGAPQL